MIDKTILLNFTTMRKCYGCKEYLTLEKEEGNVCYKGDNLFHVSCLKKKYLSKKGNKLSENDVNVLIEDLVGDSRIKIETIIYKNHLYKYLQSHYDCILLPNYIYTKLEKMFLGEYKNMSSPLPPNHLLDMFCRKASFLDKIYHKEKMDGVSRINYDLAVLISKYAGYLDWMGKKDTEEKKIEHYTIQNEGIGLTTMVYNKKIEKDEEDIFDEE